MTDLDIAGRAAWEAFCWSTLDDDGVSFEADMDDGDWRERLGDKCLSNIAATIQYARSVGYPGSMGDLGHDYALTVNHHGTGFWDRGHGDLGERLTAFVQRFGEHYLCADEDGLPRMDRLAGE